MTLIQRQIAAGVLVAVALLMWAASGRDSDGVSPIPQPPTGLVLKGLFMGPTAADDAAIVSSLTAEVGDCIQHDGTLAEPRLKTGVAFDDLRIAARELRCRGESMGQRQPKVVAAIRAYLEETLGTDGGPVTPQERAKWVSAMHDISRAAADATK
jgi:hypothetical protein